jgi:hypothetical protein
MASSAILLGAIGICLSFFPEEILVYLNVGFQPSSKIVFQLLGALYFGFAMLNWIAQWSLIGGIYNKPVSVANFSHFLVGGLALVKEALHLPETLYLLWILTALYMLYALIFGWLFYIGPAIKTNQ